MCAADGQIWDLLIQKHAMLQRANYSYVGRSIAGIASSNPVRGAWISVSCKCCVLSGRVLLRRADHSSRSHTECSVSECDSRN
jgi:hypothetical protein